jgi:serine/threonine protein phosphatase PrpC
MPLCVRVGQAAQWRPALRPREMSDRVRVHEAEDVLLVVSANSGACGWSSGWSAGSRLLLDLFMDSWRSSTGTIDARFRDAFEATRRTFPSHVKAIVSDEMAGAEGGPHGMMTAIAIHDEQFRALWIGSDSALLIRNFSIAQKCTPHTLREDARAQGMSEEDIATTLRDVETQVISDGIRNDVGQLESVAPLRAGDWLLLVNRHLLDVLSHEDVAYLASTHASPEVVANELVRLAFENGNIPHAVAVAVRWDDVPVAESVRRLIGSYEPASRHPAWLGEYSRKHEVLPVAFDMGGACCLRPDGGVVGVDWDRPDEPPQPETGFRFNLWALASAARRYPILHTLRPAPPASSLPCPRCETWRRANPSELEEGGGCPFCCYQGWVVPEPPARPRDLTEKQTGTAAAEKGKGSPRVWWQFWKKTVLR